MTPFLVKPFKVVYLPIGFDPSEFLARFIQARPLPGFALKLGIKWQAFRLDEDTTESEMRSMSSWLRSVRSS